MFNGQATYYAYNAANELLTEVTGEETTYYSYDGCGNTTAKQEAAGTTYYQWDHENLMTRVDLPEGGHSYFGYDADSKRVSKRDGGGFTEFIYQGPDMLRLLLERRPPWGAGAAPADGDDLRLSPRQPYLNSTGFLVLTMGSTAGWTGRARSQFRAAVAFPTHVGVDRGKRSAEAGCRCRTWGSSWRIWRWPGPA